MTDLEKAARLALGNICSAKLCEINSMSSRQEMIRLMDEAITALRQALSNSVEQPAKQRHIAYVCPQCHWTLEERPAQQQRKPWVGLMEEEIARVVSLAGFAPDWAEANIATQIVRVCQDILKEKNA